MTIATDTEPLDVRIAQTERRLLEAVSEAVEQLGWRCSFIELYLDGSSLTANARLSINRTLERLEPEASCRNCGCTDENCNGCAARLSKIAEEDKPRPQPWEPTRPSGY